MQPRDYQSAALDSLYWYFSNATGNPVVELPTGSGKSFVQALFIQKALGDYKDQRILCLTHVKELIRQNYEEMIRLWPTAPAGINSAGLGIRDTDDDIIFASIQSVYRSAFELGRFDLIIIDECHLVPTKSQGMYRRFLEDAKRLNSKLKVIGLSATPWRLDNGSLVEGEDALFTDLIPAKKIGASLTDLVGKGHLAPLTTPADPLPVLDVHSVGKRGGEFIAGELNQAIKKQHKTTAKACREIERRGIDRKKWIIFGTSIEHCEAIAGCLTVPVGVVSSQTQPGERARLISAFKSGELRGLVSVNVLSTGFNVPDVDLLAMLRPTNSSSLYLQQAGRGMRTADGKADCLVLDFAGNIDRHGPVDKVTPPARRKKKDGDAPVKECPECIMLVHASLRKCNFCGYEFPIVQQENINAKASNKAIMGNRLAKVEPTAMNFSCHRKAGKPTSMRVDYFCGINRVASEWVCLFHEDYSQRKAAAWWREHIGGDLPRDIHEAVELAEDRANIPAYLYLDESGKYTRIVSRGFEKEPVPAQMLKGNSAESY